MPLLVLCVFAACTATAPSSPPISPPPAITPPSTPREHAVAKLRALIELDKLERDAVARVLDARYVASEGDGRRTDHRFAATPLFAGVAMGQAGDWRFVRLDVAPEIGLALADLDPLILDAPYGTSTRHITYARGEHEFVITHHFRLARYEVVVAKPPRGHAAAGTVRDGIETAIREGIDDASGTEQRAGLEITVTTKHLIPANAPTLRAFREWARKNP